jgi:hypothetical protein
METQRKVIEMNVWVNGKDIVLRSTGEKQYAVHGQCHGLALVSFSITELLL